MTTFEQALDRIGYYGEAGVRVVALIPIAMLAVVAAPFLIIGFIVKTINPKL